MNKAANPTRTGRTERDQVIGWSSALPCGSIRQRVQIMLQADEIGMTLPSFPTTLMLSPPRTLVMGRQMGLSTLQSVG
jgi:hypothetical protein